MNLESAQRIANLIRSANTTTGQSNADLTTAMQTLIDGFGQGGGGGNAKIMTGSFVRASDLTRDLVINCSDLGFAAGEYPRGGVLWTEDFNDPSKMVNLALDFEFVLYGDFFREDFFGGLNKGVYFTSTWKTATGSNYQYGFTRNNVINYREKETSGRSRTSLTFAVSTIWKLLAGNTYHYMVWG